jgi:hypothetical protein
MLINYPNKSKKIKNLTGKQKMNLVLNGDKNLKKWYSDFIKEVKKFYMEKNYLVKNFSI